MRILLIQDSQDSIKEINHILNSKDIIIDSSSNPEEALDMCSLYEYSLIILEQMLPSISGNRLIDKIRENNIKFPIIVISRSNDMDKKINALRKGADDYLIEPFNEKEFLARIKSVIRRSNGYSHNIVSSGKLKINLSESKAYYNENLISLTKKEYMILEFLFLKKGTTLTKERFLNHLYTDNNEPEAKIIDVFICKLRKKLEDISGGINFIQTDWGRGYFLTDIKD